MKLKPSTERAIEAWQKDYELTADEVIMQALDRWEITEQHEVEDLHAVLGIFHSARPWADEITSLGRKTQNSVSSELSRLRRLMLGERVAQMEEIQRDTKAHMEVISGSMVWLLTPWWKRLFKRRAK